MEAAKQAPKRVLRPIIEPGKVVKAEKPENPTVFEHYKTKPDEIVIVESVKDGRIYVLDALLSQKYVLKKGSTFKIVRKAEREKFIGSIQKNQIQFTKGVNFLTGFDPEVFALDENEVVIPAFKYMPGKDKPITIDAVSGNHVRLSHFYDGFQAEFATEAPGHCHAFCCDNIRASLEIVLREARKFNPKAKLTHKCVVYVPFEMMQSCTTEQAALGCSPSKNAYEEKTHLYGLNPSELPFRFAGFHVHQGTTATGAKVNHRLIVKMLDAVVGVLSVAILDGMEDHRRRQFYGLAGEYREPKHGLEYRVLSSAILAHPILTIFFLDMVRHVASTAVKTSLVWDGSEGETKEIIDTLDVEQARKAISRNKKILNSIFLAIYAETRITKLFGLAEKGAKNMLPVDDMEKSWRLNGGWVNHSDGPDCCVARWC